MTESRDRKALRALLAQIERAGERYEQLFDDSAAQDALAQPDPARELVEALGNLCLEAHHFADNKRGEQFLRDAIAKARAVLEKFHG